jgi:hypothetical protein
VVDYVSIANAAVSMLEEFGKLTALGDGVTARQVNAVKWKDVKHTFGDSEVQIGDLLYIVAPTTSTGADSLPLRSERFTDQYVVVQTESVQPADVVLIWYVWVRKG